MLDEIDICLWTARTYRSDKDDENFDRSPSWSKTPNHLGLSDERTLTFWRRIFFQILAHPVFKM